MELSWERVSRHVHRIRAESAEPLCAYVYDLAALQRHAAALVASLPPRCELFYAIKANSDLPILRTLAPLVHGFEVSSGGELGWVRQYFPAIPVVLSGPGKTDSELSLALDKRVEAIHAESLSELERLAATARERGTVAPVLLRVNLAIKDVVGTTLMMGGGPTPFGIAADQLPACLEWTRRHPEIRVRGLHFHLLSHQLDAAAHLQLLQTYLRQVHQWIDAYGLSIDHVNVGGGIGINYRELERQFDWPLFATGLKRLVNDARLRIRMEYGRFISAACGYYATQAIDIKHAFGRNYIVVRGGTHHFRTPYAQGHSHPFRVLPVEHWPYDFERPALSSATAHVVGQLCTPKDLLAFDATIEQVRAGDIIVFPFAGAYAWHISHHDFLRHPHPQQYYLPVKELARVAN